MPTEDRVWLGGCRKWGYPTRPDAMDALIEVRAAREAQKSEDPEKSVYRCRRCGRWHLSRSLQDEPNNNAPDLRVRGRELALLG